jgi:hypothetical protein
MLQMNLIIQEELCGEVCHELYWELRRELYGELWGELYWGLYCGLNGEVYSPLGDQIRADFSHSKISRV